MLLAYADGFSSTPGRGVTATIDGRVVRVGSPVLLTDPAVTAAADVGTSALAQARGVVAELEACGRTAVVVLLDDIPAGVLGLTDRLRPDARATVQALTALTGATPVLLTGDNPGAAARPAEEVGITDVRAGLLPADKVTQVRALQAAGHRVLLVGDGVNDAPAMAAADLGVAMGRHGSDLALETSDAVVVRDDLVTWDIFWLLPLPLGVAGHEGSTVVVGLNGLRLLRAAAWRRAGATSIPRPEVQTQEHTP